MFSLSKIKEICADTFLIAGYNLDDYNISITINNRLRTTLGRCKGKYINGVFTPYALEFSKLLLDTSTDKSVVDVIKHECAHVLVSIETGEYHGHDAVFKQMCKRIGTDNDGRVTKNIERTVDESKIYKYFVICKECGQVCGKYHRKGQVVKHPVFYSCKCGGGLNVVQNF